MSKWAVLLKLLKQDKSRTEGNPGARNQKAIHIYSPVEIYDKAYKTWQNPYHMPYHPEIPISARGPLDPRDDIGRGWYGIWYGFCHVFYALSYISTGELYYMNCFLIHSTGLPSVLLFSCFKGLKRTAQLLIGST